MAIKSMTEKWERGQMWSE